ncbi:MAG: signal peptidase I [Elusimicrobia bacterium]|nr:signal peptidase I [Elusimicrobiota bacterium]
MIPSIVGMIFWFGVAILVIAGMWKTFSKAGKPGWAAVIPVYNVIVLLQIAAKPWWWLFLLIIPVVNIAINIMVSISVAQAFGKGTGFGLGLSFLGPIFYPILGFGDSQYVGISEPGVQALPNTPA